MLDELERDPLAWILGFSSSERFVEERLGKHWFHARCDDPDRFAALLTLADLDEVLGRFGVRYPSIKLVRSDGPVPVSEYLWRDNMVDPARVASLFADGATVIFGGLHDRHEPARRLCAAVARQIPARTQTNIYLTPPNSQGFKPHWDTHDVFVLQVEGSKRWRMYDGGPELPLKDQKFDPDVHAPGKVECEFTLQPGEALYVPRGFMHAAATTDSVSVHITLGVMSYTWADLLVDCLAEVVERSPQWRENVPFGFVRQGQVDTGLASALAERIASLDAELDLARVLVERERTFSAHLRPRAIDHLQQVSSVSRLEEGDEVRWRDGVTGEIEPRNGRVALLSGGRELEFPTAAAQTLDRVLTGENLVAGDIPDALDWPSRRVVLAALIREGWLTRSND